MTEATPPVVAAPQTGNRLVDDALAALSDLDQHDVAEHHDRLAAAQDVLNQVLEDSRRPEQIPAGLRPQQDHA